MDNIDRPSRASADRFELVAELENDVDDESGSRRLKGKMRAIGSKGDARHRTVRLRGQQFRPTGEFWTNDGVARR